MLHVIFMEHCWNKVPSNRHIITVYLSKSVEPKTIKFEVIYDFSTHMKMITMYNAHALELFFSRCVCLFVCCCCVLCDKFTMRTHTHTHFVTSSTVPLFFIKWGCEMKQNKKKCIKQKSEPIFSSHCHKMWKWHKISLKGIIYCTVTGNKSDIRHFSIYSYDFICFLSEIDKAPRTWHRYMKREPMFDAMKKLLKNKLKHHIKKGMICTDN